MSVRSDSDEYQVPGQGLPITEPSPPFEGELSELWPEFVRQTFLARALGEQRQEFQSLAGRFQGYAGIKLYGGDGYSDEVWGKPLCEAPSAATWPFQLKSAGVEDQPEKFIVEPGVVGGNTTGGLSVEPKLGAGSIFLEPIQTATASWQRVYLKVEIALEVEDINPDPGEQLWEIIGGDVETGTEWEVVLTADSDPTDNRLPELDRDAETAEAAAAQTGIYYELIGKVRIVDGSLEFNQQMYGPVGASFCPTTRSLTFSRPQIVQAVYIQS